LIFFYCFSWFSVTSVIASVKSGGKPSYTLVFGYWLCDMAEMD